MTSVKFIYCNKNIIGFTVKGHSTTSQKDLDGKLVCSAVSSAVYLTLNTVTDVIGAKADIELNDGFVNFKLLDKVSECQDVLKGFSLHMNALSEQYKHNIEITEQK